jgi:hypothetical protein
MEAGKSDALYIYINMAHSWIEKDDTWPISFKFIPSYPSKS